MPIDIYPKLFDLLKKSPIKNRDEKVDCRVSF